MQDGDANFPTHTKDPLVRILQAIISFGVKILAIFMTILILWSIWDVGYILYQQAIEPPYFSFKVDEILSTFGAFLVVLIAIEIFLNILLYLREDVSHLKLVIATALMAIARKVIILDYDKFSAMHLYGIAAVVAALGLSYWLVSRATIKKGPKIIDI